MPEFAQEAPEPFDTYLPGIEVEHVRELRSAVPQLQHLLCVQKPSVCERLEDRTRQYSASSLRREASFFSHTPPKYAANVPVSGSAPVVIHSRTAGCQSPSWFAGDEMEFSPADQGSGAFLGTVPSPAIPTMKADDTEDTRPRPLVVSDSDSETAMANQDSGMISSVGNGGAARSAPIRIPMSNRNSDGVTGTPAAMMTASRGQFSEKGGSSGKFGTPNEHLLETPLEEEERTNDNVQTQTSTHGSIAAGSTIQQRETSAEANAAKDEALSRDLAEKAAKLIEALETEQTLRRELKERDSQLDSYRTLLSSKIVPELVEFRRFIEEVKRMFEELTAANAKSNNEWADVIDRAARKLESNLQTDLEEARKAEDELRKTELDTKVNELQLELEEERKRARDFQKQLENSEAFLKQKDDVIELLQQRLQELESSFTKQIEDAKSDLMKRLLIEQELTTDTLRAGYEREIEIKDAEIQQLKQELTEKQQVLRDMKREQDR